jgi:6-phospho-beta-glucosidase
MALRSIHVMAEIAAEMESVCPRAWIVNYTNPVNIVAQALTAHTNVPFVSLCEGPIVYPRFLAEAAGLNPDSLSTVMVGLNHASWSVQHSYNGSDVMPLLQQAYALRGNDPTLPPERRRQLQLAVAMDSIPSEYFQYYYFGDEILEELLAKPTTRAEDIVAEVPEYWKHYEEQADADHPALDPGRSRIGILELELAIDVISALYNPGDDETLYVNVPNRGALHGLPDELVVELPGRVGRAGIEPIPQPTLPRHVLGLVEALAEYQLCAAEAAWSGTRRDAVRALASNPLVRSLPKAEAIYDEMSSLHAHLLPERLVA